MARIKLSSGDRYFPQAEESRQHYANVRIAEFQRFYMSSGSYDFADLLQLFRFYGEEYDRGARLRDDPLEGAA